MRYSSSHALKLGSLKRVPNKNADSSEGRFKRGMSSSSVVASIGDPDYAPENKLMGLRLKDSQNHLIVDKALFLSKKKSSLSRGKTTNIDPRI